MFLLLTSILSELGVAYQCYHGFLRAVQEGNIQWESRTYPYPGTPITQRFSHSQYMLLYNTSCHNDLRVIYTVLNEAPFFPNKSKIQNFRLCIEHFKIFQCGFRYGSDYELSVQQIKWLLPCARLVNHEKSNIRH